MSRPLPDEVKEKIDKFLDELYLDVGTDGTTVNITEEYLIKLLTRFAVSIATAWWSLSELFDYIQNRRTVKGFRNAK
jgi:hypothetical protein